MIMMESIEVYNLDSNIIQVIDKFGNCYHYMLIGYDTSNFYLFNLQTNDITIVQEQWFEERQIRIFVLFVLFCFVLFFFLVVVAK